jgi:hypothetical protein
LNEAGRDGALHGHVEIVDIVVVALYAGVLTWALLTRFRASG